MFIFIWTDPKFNRKVSQKSFLFQRYIFCILAWHKNYHIKFLFKRSFKRAVLWSFQQSNFCLLFFFVRIVSSCLWWENKTNGCYKNCSFFKKAYQISFSAKATRFSYHPISWEKNVLINLLNNVTVFKCVDNMCQRLPGTNSFWVLRLGYSVIANDSRKF